MNVIARDNRQEKERQAFELAKGLVVNPVTMLVAGFSLANILEHVEIGKTKEITTTTHNNSILRVLFPPLAIFMPDKTVTSPAGSSINVLTEDQANVLRTALTVYALGAGFSPVLKELKNG